MCLGEEKRIKAKTDEQMGLTYAKTYAIIKVTTNKDSWKRT